MRDSLGFGLKVRGSMNARSRTLALVLVLAVVGVVGPIRSEPVALTHAPSSLHNVYQASERVLSGSQPEGEGAFAWLAAQGVKTILSVDGARPDVEAARRHGLRYVHLPVGYDGIASNRVVELAALASRETGPLYVHCHHGKHRGPAAAAVVCRAAEGWSPQVAEAFLKQAGTSPDYPGLYRSVREFRAPDAAALARLPSVLPEANVTTGLVQAMVALDERVEHLRACQKAGWRPPPAHPDIAPVHEATQLLEHLQELVRLESEASRVARFRSLLDVGVTAARELQASLRASAPDPLAVDPAFKRVTDNCAACHQQHRNAAGDVP